MKWVYIIVAVVIIVLLGWFFFGGSEEADEALEGETAGESISAEQTTVDGDGTDTVVEGDDAEGGVSFDVAGDDFSFDMEEIRVKEGDTVTINFTSTEGFHDWVVDEFEAATEKVQTGGTTSVTFVADQKGTFEYYCSVGNHREQGMVGNLIVE